MREYFKSVFGGAPRIEVDVGARICVLGEHSDYVPYLNSHSITFASAEQRMRALIRPRVDGFVKLETTLPNLQEDSCYSFDIRSLNMGRGWLDELDSRGPPESHWSNYVKGAVAYLVNEPDTMQIDKGFEMLIDSDIPSASGASSSSALTVCGMIVTSLVNGLDWTANEIAVAAGEAEWFVGTRGGNMDHTTMVCAENGNMLKIEYRPWNTVDVMPSSERGGGCKWYTVFTHPAEKGGAVRDAFNELVFVQQEIIPRYLDEIGHDLHNDAKLIESQLPETVEDARYGCVRVRDRFRFVMNEYARVQRFEDVIQRASSPSNGPKFMDEIGDILHSSWNDTRDLLGTHTPEMERIAAEIRAKKGVLGVKVLGAGFGGNLLVCATADVDLGTEAVKHTPGKGFNVAVLT